MEEISDLDEPGVHLDLHEDNMKSPKQLTIVIKLGTSSIVDEKTHQPLLSILGLIVETVTKLRQNGHRVVLVSSGAIGVGLQRMQIDKKPKTLGKKQALAAVGQCRLMSMWDSLFTHMGLPVAQILLTRNDIADRTRYQNAQNTFAALMNLGAVPIVNENDTLSVSEIKFGDNDTLSAITAAMVQADYLFLMTDVDCLYTANPRSDPDAKPIEIVSDISQLQADVSSAGSALGTGGMSTKITAARLGTSAGVTTVITKSSKPGNVLEIVRHSQALKAAAKQSASSTDDDSAPQIPSAPLHTRFLPSSSPIRDRSFWLLYGLAPHGTIYIDEGAHKAISTKAGLLPIGVVAVEGHFNQQESVRIVVVKRLMPPQRYSRAGSLGSSEGSTRSSSPSSPMTPGTPAKMERTHSGMSSARMERTHSTASVGKMERSYSAMSAGKMERSHSSWSTSSKDTEPFPDFHDQSQYSFEHINDPPVEVGRALVNYSSSEIRRVAGLRSSEIYHMLGYADSEYVALRENVSLTHKASSSKTSGAKSGTSSPTPAKAAHHLTSFA